MAWRAGAAAALAVSGYEPRMTIQVNGRAESVEDGISIAALLFRMGLARDGIAVAVNGAVVPWSAHGERVISPADQVEVIQAVGGG